MCVCGCGGVCGGVFLFLDVCGGNVGEGGVCVHVCVCVCVCVCMFEGEMWGKDDCVYM